MKLDFHVLTVFPPHNVNRDEDGRPKTAMFGGVQRGRISSQAKKRAIRLSPHFQDLQRHTRTRKAGVTAYKALKEKGVLNEMVRVMAAQAVNYAIGGKKEVPNEKSARTLIQSITEKKLSEIRETHAFDTDSAREHVLQRELWTEQALVVSTKEFAALHHFVERIASECAAPGKEAVEKAKPLCEEICRGLLLIDGETEVDTALFGRMVATQPRFNVEAACSVSHAITTHRFSVEGDYFSAAEELSEKGETGAAITSYAFFGAGVYYQHAVLDLKHLTDSLNGDADRARKAARAFVDGLCAAQPTGKRNSHGSDVLASYVLCGRGTAPSFNGALAFLKPVQPSEDQDILAASAEKLRSFYEVVRESYGLGTDYIVYAAAPSLRRANAPEAPEVWDVDALHRFVEEAVPAAAA
ncbi:type I-E CRISPR-associated protein Cas7/Cse4/CasC [Caenispirillum salinarum]|uniref:type I-E CRISPR-associated protein Cas7/Cse4/CasC n=1 Tax=Caenispirillum salinarum TaxID=859058 RepID=UPI00385102B6